MKNTVKVIAVMLFVAVFMVGRLSAHQPPVADHEIYGKALKWCQDRISVGANVDYFEKAVENINARNIRWSIDDPSGLHYSLLLEFASAMDAKMQREEKVVEEKGSARANNKEV